MLEERVRSDSLETIAVYESQTAPSAITSLPASLPPLRSRKQSDGDENGIYGGKKMYKRLKETKMWKHRRVKLHGAVVVTYLTIPTSGRCDVISTSNSGYPANFRLFILFI